MSEVKIETIIDESIYFHGFDKGDGDIGVYTLTQETLDPDKISFLNLVNKRDYDQIKKENAILLEALELAVKSGEFYRRHADCRKESWSCRCEFCKDNSASKNLREARQALEKVKSE